MGCNQGKTQRSGRSQAIKQLVSLQLRILGVILSQLTIMSAPFSTRLRERIAWLGRMPWHYRILFGGQAVFLIGAWQYRQVLVERRRRQLEIEQAADEITQMAGGSPKPEPTS